MAKLANFEVTFELKELKIHVKGDREIAPSIANNVGRQFANVFSPAGLIEGPKNGRDDGGKVVEVQAPTPRSRKKRTAKTTTDGNGVDPLTWTHDTSRWGSPVQGWKTLQKSAWLLLVVSQALDKHDLSAGEISDVFKANFRDAGPPRPSNIARDLSKDTALFGEENGRFFLKQAGKDLAERLIAEASGASAAA
jgi:hypothetical protein